VTAALKTDKEMLLNINVFVIAPHVAVFQMTNDYHRLMQAAVATENILTLK